MKSDDSSKNTFRFRWTYVLLPWIFLALSVILVTVYYNLLPFQVAWHFASDGTADGWVIQPLIVFWTLLPQVFFTIGATVITWILTLAATRFLKTGELLVNPGRIFMFVGNMVAIPQLIILFAMLDIFTYNTNYTHLRPSVLVFSIIVLVAGGIGLSVFFIRTMMQVWRGKINEVQMPKPK